jgi:hypothetical protein
MATIKKSVVKRPLAKKQSGGPADAMRKAMGQKPTSTKETLKYVSKNGSGYIPPVKSDTTGGKNASDTIRKKPAMLDSAEDAIMRNLGIKKSNKKDGAAMKTDFDKLGYKKGGAIKPKAQLGAIVKGIKAIGKGASKLNEMRPLVKYKNYVPGGHGKKALLKQGAEMAIIGGAGTAAASKAVLSGVKKPVAKKKK